MTQLESLRDGWRRPGVKWLIAFTVGLLAFAYLIGLAKAEPASQAQASEAVWLALIVAVPATLTGLISGPVTIWLTSRGKAAERREDWARQDRIAAEAKTTADQAASDARVAATQATAAARKTAETATLLLASNERVAGTAEETIKQLGAIHTLVNSGLTEEKQRAYDATRRELILLIHIIEMNEAAGRHPSADALAEVAATRKSIEAMKLDLVDRVMRAQAVQGA